MAQHVEHWPIDKLIFYARNPRKNDSAVDRMCGSIREFGFKIPVLARSDGEVVDGHLRLKAARKLGITDRSGSISKKLRGRKAHCPTSDFRPKFGA
jgi:ParB-like chromosome segregation protein Spo0J